MVGVGWPLYDDRVLRRLRIENLVLIRGADLEFAPGLNAITGETGAGKTILAQAIGLLLGAKGDAAYLGPGSPDAYVEAEFDLPPGGREDRARGPRRARARRGAPPPPPPPRISPHGPPRAYSWGRSAARED